MRMVLPRPGSAQGNHPSVTIWLYSMVPMPLYIRITAMIIRVMCDGPTSVYIFMHPCGVLAFPVHSSAQGYLTLIVTCTVIAYGGMLI